MTQPTCETCRFFFPLTDPQGVCRRYPTFVDRFFRERCGEHKPKTPIVTENLT
jgi:hypothetical protein